MEIIYKIVGFVGAIAILVAVHEWGHYIAARLTGMRADIFSLGMGKRLFGWNKKTGFTFGRLPSNHNYDGDTDWRLCIFPIGGYVKIPGMVDESFDNEFASKEIKPYEFRAKNTLQKAFVLSNGVIMNFILAILVFAGMSYFYGTEKSASTKIGYVQQGSLSDELGFRAGDSILSINDNSVSSFEDFVFDLSLTNMGSEVNVNLIRNGRNETLSFNTEKIISLLASKADQKLPPNYLLGFDIDYNRVYVGAVLSATPAEKIGLLPGDEILTLNGEPINSYQKLTGIIKSNNSKLIDITWKRNDEIFKSDFTPKDGLVGIRPSINYYGPIKKETYSLGESLKIGFNRLLDFLGIIIESFNQIGKGNIKVEDAVAGPAKIFQQAGESVSRGFKDFLFLVAQLSISLGLINILPIPALDGGHLLITIIEGIKGSELPTRLKILIQNLGVLFLLILFIVIFYLDIVDLVK